MSGAVIATAVIATAVAVDTVATVGFTIGAALAVTAAVGSTVAAIGTLTHDKTLTMVGGAIGAVGAIGGLASSAGLFAGEVLGSQAGGALADTAAGTTAAETASPFGAAASGTDAGTWAGAAAGAAPASSDGVTITKIVDSLGGTVEQPATATTAVAAAESPTVTPAAATDTGASPVAGIDNPQQAANLIPNAGGQGGETAPSLQNATTAGRAPNAPASSSPATPAAPDVESTLNAWNSAQDPLKMPVTGKVDLTNKILAGSTGAPGMPQSTADSLINGGSGTNVPGFSINKTGSGDPTQSVFSKLMDVVKTPGGGTLLSGVIQAGGAFIGGATSTLTPAQVKALNAQAEANQAAANLSTQQLANMREPMPVARRVGLINSTITGAPT